MMNVTLTWNQLCSPEEFAKFAASKVDFHVVYYYLAPTNGNNLNSPLLAKEFNLYVLTLKQVN
jgi:hypothetical protein